MNNRIPMAILVVLVLVAFVWRVAHPPAPPLPGPLGAIPAWDSRTKIGDMGPSAVSPSGSFWAGAWNQKTASGELRSAILVIDLEKPRAFRQEIKSGSVVPSLSWKDDDTVRALVVDSDDPERIRTARIACVRRTGGESLECRTTALKQPVARILAWSSGSDKFAALLPGVAGKARVAVLSESGDLVGKVAEVELPPVASVHHTAAISPDGGWFVFSVAEDKVGGNITYYFADSRTGFAHKAFSLAELPGRVEGMWVSRAGVLTVCAEREKFQVLGYLFETAKSKLTPLGAKTDVTRGWPDAPKTMMFVTYNGGYELNLADGKVKQLFDLTKQGRYSDSWRRHVQDGRLYPRKDGDYTSISLVANEVDIRVIKKSGDKGPNILTRG